MIRPVKNKAFSLWDKLRWAVLVFLYGNSHVAHWRLFCCENCGSYRLDRVEGSEKELSFTKVKRFRATYRCRDCGAEGYISQAWTKM